jgi:glycosyltransferase involved in cell wall biosynthesis
VLATSTPLTIGIPALIKKWIHKTPFIFETRDIWPEAAIALGVIKNKIFQKILYFAEYIIYKNAAVIVPLSRDMKRSIALRYPKLVEKPIKVIENISEIDRFQNSLIKKKSILKKKIGFKPRFSILYAGTFGRINGINYVIELANTLVHLDPTIAFILIGNGVEKKALIHKARDSGVLNKNVFILDSVSKQELPQLYFECDMGSSFVIGVKELWANSANKFFDTLAAGKPILINYKGWQKEVINKENIGYVLPVVLNNNRLKKFVLYSKKKVLIAKQKKNALKIARAKYARSIALGKYNKLFDDIFINVKNEL